jgi:hypothetical protein
LEKEKFLGFIRVSIFDKAAVLAARPLPPKLTWYGSFQHLDSIISEIY